MKRCGEKGQGQGQGQVQTEVKVDKCWTEPEVLCVCAVPRRRAVVVAVVARVGEGGGRGVK